VYEAYWGLREKPFENTPDPRFLFLGDEAQEVFARLLYALQGLRGAAVLTGPAGCGKTLMARSLVQQLPPEQTAVAVLNNPRWGAAEFLRELLYQLGNEGQPETRADVVHRLEEILYENHAAGKQTLVLIDEGQLLADGAVLEEIRLLLNYQLNDAFLINLLLVGQPVLAQQIRAHAPLDQRIAVRGVVRPLSSAAVGAYINHRLRTAGSEQSPFTDDAVALIGRHTAGVPRQINNLCDIALVIGFSRHHRQIDGEAVTRLLQAEGGDGA
jgi:general secretion pathway protein A